MRHPSRSVMILVSLEIWIEKNLNFMIFWIINLKIKSFLVLFVELNSYNQLILVEKDSLRNIDLELI